MNASALAAAPPENFEKDDITTTLILNQRNEAWDQFIREHACGNHVQTGLWASVKTVQKWQSLLILLHSGETIIGGAQMLFRPLPLKFAGSIAYIPKGPVFAEFNEERFNRFSQVLKTQLKNFHIRHLILQPPRCDANYTDILHKTGFHTSTMSFAPTATVVVDLQQELDEILASMKPKTRYNIRKAERQGITMRAGDI